MPNRDALWVLPSGATTVVEVDEDGNRVTALAEIIKARELMDAAPVPTKDRHILSEPFGGKGDHDGDGKVGGAHEAVDDTPKPKRKAKGN